MTIKREDMFYKANDYELRPITENEAQNLSLGSQVYIKHYGVAFPMKISKCYENAERFVVEPMA